MQRRSDLNYQYLSHTSCRSCSGHTPRQQQAENTPTCVPASPVQRLARGKSTARAWVASPWCGSGATARRGACPSRGRSCRRTRAVTHWYHATSKQHTSGANMLKRRTVLRTDSKVKTPLTKKTCERPSSSTVKKMPPVYHQRALEQISEYSKSFRIFNNIDTVIPKKQKQQRARDVVESNTFSQRLSESREISRCASTSAIHPRSCFREETVCGLWSMHPQAEGPPRSTVPTDVRLSHWENSCATSMATSANKVKYRPQSSAGTLK